MSSAAAVAFIKRLTGEKCGHAGTLDPEVAGVLPVMIGRATRLQDYFTDKTKAYIGEICFTGATDTQDAQGSLMEAGRGAPDRDTLEAVIRSTFTGDIRQVPPMYSAVKLQGRPLYALAREGKTAEVSSRPIHVDACEVLGRTDAFTYRLRVVCSAGTYIRTLCHDIGQALGMPAHMRTLVRIRSGFFALEDSIPPEQLARDDGWLRALVSMEAPLREYARITLQPRERTQARNGVPVPAAAFCLAEGQIVRVWADGAFFGLAACQEGMLKMRFLAEV